MTLVTACYVLINIAYIAVLGKEGILGSSAVALVSRKHVYKEPSTNGQNVKTF